MDGSATAATFHKDKSIAMLHVWGEIIMWTKSIRFFKNVLTIATLSRVIHTRGLRHTYTGTASYIHGDCVIHTRGLRHTYTGTASYIHGDCVVHTRGLRRTYTGSASYIHGDCVIHTRGLRHTYTGTASYIHGDYVVVENNNNTTSLQTCEMTPYFYGYLMSHL